MMLRCRCVVWCIMVVGPEAGQYLQARMCLSTTLAEYTGKKNLEPKDPMQPGIGRGHGWVESSQDEPKLVGQAAGSAGLEVSDVVQESQPADPQPNEFKATSHHGQCLAGRVGYLFDLFTEYSIVSTRLSAAKAGYELLEHARRPLENRVLHTTPPSAMAFGEMGYSLLTRCQVSTSWPRPWLPMDTASTDSLSVSSEATITEQLSTQVTDDD